MKTLFYKLMAFFAVTTLIASCEKEILPANGEEQLQTLTIGALSNNPDTRINATPNEGGALGFKLSWAEGDRLIASTADGASYVAAFEIKSATDIADDGSAKFTALESNTTLLDLDTEYLFHNDYSNEKTAYNVAMTAEAYNFDDFYDEAGCSMYPVLYTASATTIDKPIILTHLFSYVELTVNIPDKDKTVVRFKYTDKDTSKEFSQKFYFVEDGSDDSNYTFSFPVYPATLTAEKPITIELSTDTGTTFSPYFSKAVDGAFEAGKHYHITASKGLYLADISADDVPEGDEWTIEDTNATADNKDKFAGVIAALKTIEATRTINLVFPNLTRLPLEALYGCKPTAKWTFSAPNVDFVQGNALYSTENITTIDLPKATTIAQGLCNAESLVALTIAKEERVISTVATLFLNMPTENIDLITHPSNVDGMKFKLADDILIGPFKSVNGLIDGVGFPDDAVLIMQETMLVGTRYKTTQKGIPAEGITLYSDTIDDKLENMTFYVGYDKSSIGSSFTTTYKKFADVKWKSSELLIKGSYLNFYSDEDGSMKIRSTGKIIPTIPVTITYTVKAPNKATMSCDVHLKRSAMVVE